MIIPSKNRMGSDSKTERSMKATGVSFIAIANHILGERSIRLPSSHFEPVGNPGSSATSQAGGLHFGNHLFPA